MKALTKVLAGGVAMAALASAAPAAAQYYPGYNYGYGYPNGGNVVGQVLNQVLGGYGYNGYGSNTRIAAQQCAAAVEQRLNGGYGGGGYGGYNGGYGGYGARVVAITHADIHGGGIAKIRGRATTGGGYGDGYPGQSAELKFMCEVDPRGYIRDLHIDPVYGSYNNGYSPYDPYAQYGYRRY